MMRATSKCLICCVSVSFIIAATFYVLVFALSSVAAKPRFYVQELYVPFLGNSTGYNSSSSSVNASIFVDLKFRRRSTFTPLRYDHLNITLFYNFNRSSAVGYYALPGFVQGYKKTAHRRAVVEGRGVPWEDAIQKVSGGSTVAFTVAVAAEYRLERCTKDSCSYQRATPAEVAVEADVEVDGSGRKVFKKPIRLR